MSRKWTAEEDNFLIKKYTRTDVAVLAKMFRRTERAVMTRACGLGINRKSSVNTHNVDKEEKKKEAVRKQTSIANMEDRLIYLEEQLCKPQPMEKWQSMISEYNALVIRLAQMKGERVVIMD